MKIIFIIVFIVYYSKYSPLIKYVYDRVYTYENPYIVDITDETTTPLSL